MIPLAVALVAAMIGAVILFLYPNTDCAECAHCQKIKAENVRKGKVEAHRNYHWLNGWIRDEATMGCRFCDKDEPLH